MRFKGEMSRVKKLNPGLRNIPLERLRTSRQKERIVFAPDSQERWLIPAEVFLKLGIQRHVVRVVLEKIELHIVGPRTSQIKVVERTTVGRYQTQVGDTMRVLERGRFRLEEGAQSVAIVLRRILPVGANGIPA